jgi:hypothetical protein
LFDHELLGLGFVEQVEGVVVGDVALVDCVGQRFDLLVEGGRHESAVDVAFGGVGAVVYCVVGGGYSGSCFFILLSVVFVEGVESWRVLLGHFPEVVETVVFGAEEADPLVGLSQFLVVP